MTLLDNVVDGVGGNVACLLLRRAPRFIIEDRRVFYAGVAGR
jgi:hypothetical protein